MFMPLRLSPTRPSVGAATPAALTDVYVALAGNVCVWHDADARVKVVTSEGQPLAVMEPLKMPFA
jgi:hypothetical protein